MSRRRSNDLCKPVGPADATAKRLEVIGNSINLQLKLALPQSRKKALSRSGSRMAWRFQLHSQDSKPADPIVSLYYIRHSLSALFHPVSNGPFFFEWG